MAITLGGGTKKASTISGGIDLKAILEELLTGFRVGQTERQQDKAQGIDALMKAIGLFDESYGKGTEKKAQAKFAQSAASRGLAGSTVPASISAGLGQEFEDMRRGRLGGALTQLAQFFSSFDAQRPSAATVSHTATGGFGAMAGVSAQNAAARDAASDYSVTSGASLSGPRGGRPVTPSIGGAWGTGSAGGGNGAGDSAQGNLSKDVARQQEQQRRTAPTYAGMEANYGIQGETSLGPEPDWDIPQGMFTPDWAEEAAYQGGWTG